MAQEPVVGVIMGSDSDLKVVKDTLALLDELGIAYEARIKSAHRTAHEMAEYAQGARLRGLKVIIAAAGGAAHLPGMTEAFMVSSVPVIGLPIKTSTAEGIDSLFSIVQMPPGRPVGCMAINGAKNAALYAAQIIGLGDDAVAQKVDAFQKKLRQEVLDKDSDLAVMGWRAYLEKYKLL